MHPHLDPAFDLIPPAGLITLGYLARVRVKPFKTCRRCAGYGKLPAGIRGRGRKTCPRCGGKGLRPRAFRTPTRTTRQIRRDAFDRPGGRGRSRPRRWIRR